ncbi:MULTISPECIES: elongation factor P 5-aminopentanone reductase [unclassified Romboutsia]|uniref:elongation factor P 5-aminopentanone reductase n=1 Tax=unclassified Romboutsia TaxID=2626894 RepID=UPI0008215689|nr:MULTISPECIES: SDR family NAD(P)-dependent oxidoreductase [unclassified Romboutsia]SCH66039.1 3-oxoacyl-[acyl-carrier-protein] reductase FabG [uncultured Clostridium sp.]
MNKKTVLITGASRGIGRAIAKTFAENNYNVIINYNKSEEEAKNLYNELNDKGYSVRIFKADVSNIIEVNSLVNYCIGQFEKIDVLINNAGISKTNLFTDITYEEWNEVMNVNLNSVFYTTKKALQYMIPEMSGKIINISSIWGIAGGAYEVHYSASKAALIGMSKALAKELGPSNITVNCIAPGVIKTDMLNNISDDTLDMLKEETPLMRLGTPEDIARCALFLANEGGDFITGQVISPNGGFII